MKALKKIVIVLVVLNMSTWLASNKAQAQMTVNFQVFYDQLSPYGEWVNYPEYGYVWVPNVEAGFTPYSTDGYWEFSDYGWMWVSDYNWGWAPFHYGRWLYDNYYGWVWVPGNEWSPAWVCWRESAGYYGWAPLCPGFDINIRFGFNNYYRLPYNCWTFVPVRYINSRTINRYYINRSNNVTIINNTTIINNIHIDRRTNNNYFIGPNRNEVERNTGREVKPVIVKNSTKPGQSLEHGELNLYRPRITASNNSTVAAAPAHVMKRDEVTPVSLRSTDNFQNNKSFENNENKSVASAQGGNMIRGTSANNDGVNAGKQLRQNQSAGQAQKVNQSRGQVQKVNQSQTISGNAKAQPVINNPKTVQNVKPAIQQSRSVSNESRNANASVQSHNSAGNQTRSFQNNATIKNGQQKQSSDSDRPKATVKPHSK